MNKKIIKKHFSIILFSLVIILSLFSCKNNNDHLDKLVITYVPSPLNVPSIIEKEKNFFNKRFNPMGINCEYANIDSGSEQTMALASNDIHLLNAVGGSSVIIAASNGLDIKIISMYSRSPKAFMMFSNDENINEPKDLIGKKIACPMGTNLHELLVAYLKKDNISINDINFISMDILHSVSALLNKSVDVALVGGNATYNLLKENKHKICDGEGLIAGTILTCCTNEFYNKHKNIVEEFKKIQNEIVDYMNTNYDEAINITAKSLDTDVSAIKEMYEYYDFSPIISEKDKELLKSTEKFLFENKLIDKHVDIDNLFIK